MDTTGRGRLPALPTPRRRRITTTPEPGYFRLHLVRRGVWVPALIWRPCPLLLPERRLLPGEETGEGEPGPEDWGPVERSRPLRARIGFAEADPQTVWERGFKIPAAEYRWRLGLAEWAVAWAPAQPEANPRLRVDLSKLPSLF